MRLFLLTLTALMLGGVAHAQDPVPLSLPDLVVYAEPGSVAGTAVEIPVTVGADLTPYSIQSADIIVRFDSEVVNITSVEIGDFTSGCATSTNVRDADEEGFREAVAVIACGSSNPFSGGPGPLVTLRGALTAEDYARSALTLVDPTPFTRRDGTDEVNVPADVADGSLLVVTDPDPQIEAVGDQTVEEDGSLTVELTLSDQDTPLADVQLAASGGAALVPAGGVSFGACAGERETDDACRALTLTPAEDATGTTTITLTATDNDDRSDDTSVTFDLTVTPVNDGPTTAAPIEDQETTAGFDPSTFDLTPVFSDVDGDALTYSATSSDASVATASVEGFTLSLTPLTPGTTTVTVVATDTGGLTAETTFTLSVAANTANGAAPLPTAFSLRGNHPNPAAAATEIALDLPAAADVRVEVFDATGRRVQGAAGSLAAGANRSLRLDAAALPAGVYVYRVVAEMSSGVEIAAGQLTVVR